MSLDFNPAFQAIFSPVQFIINNIYDYGLAK
jgi:hypothetical protein